MFERSIVPLISKLSSPKRLLDPEDAYMYIQFLLSNTVLFKCSHTTNEEL
jgi:hypothetical protein